ncbi:MAG: hypothetical protein Kow0099_08430 [Candidatus Abyssubacteria bacterium]
MISKGDLVKMRLVIGDSSGPERLTDLFVLGKVMNYCEEEDSYIIEPRALSIPKRQVREVETLPKDFDFDDVSMELSVTEKKREREAPPDIANIRFHRGR